MALRAVVGTKADLLDGREVSTEEALVSILHPLAARAFFEPSSDSVLQGFCQEHSGNAVPLPYYETSTKFCDSILLAFQEIMARPLINDYVVSDCRPS